MRNKPMDGRWLYETANKNVDLTKIDKEYVESIVFSLKMIYQLEVEDGEDFETALNRQKELPGYFRLWNDVWSIGGVGKGSKNFVIGVFAYLSAYNQKNTINFIKNF